ncbi:hypothetical protein GCM10022219_11570 [Microbacterium oryzae]
MTRANRDTFGRLATGLCPDCNPESRTVEIAPKITVLQVVHDDTCPTLRAREARR